MKALAIDRAGCSPEILTLPDPEIVAGSVLIRINVAGANPIDWKRRDGEAGDLTYPFVIGQDFAGVVERTGDGVTHLKPGDRVFGSAAEFGAYAEKTLVLNVTPIYPVAVTPDALGDDGAAALPTPALTALASLAILDVKTGSSLLVVGAGGAVGGAALQIAHQRGARVAAFVRPGQESEARAFGADMVVTGDEGVRTAVRASSERPFDAVFDLVSDDAALKENVVLIRPGGRLVSTVHTADVAWFADRGIDATNVILNQTPDFSAQNLAELAKMTVNGTLVVKIAGERSLETANALLDEMKASKASGKFVVRVGAA